jgi:hypothetical protein
LTELKGRFAEVPEDYLVQVFFPRIRDWCLDERQKAKPKVKFDERGRLARPRAFIGNCLSEEAPEKIARWQGEHRARAPTELAEPEGIVVADPGCPQCRGKGLSEAGPCNCLRPDKQP